MKGLLVVFIAVSGVVTEPPAPYPPSGWRPSGPSFELPPQQQKPEYLPPFDPRRVNPPPSTSSSSDDNVRVQGLPTQEQLPLFQVSPINGQQYVGSTFNSDIRNLDKDFQQSQFQKQQARSGQFAKQRELDTRIPVSPDANYSPDPIAPSQFAPRPTFPTEVVIAPRPRTTAKTTEATVASKQHDVKSTKPIQESEQRFNQGEEYSSQNSDQSNQKVSIEVTKENMQEYPPELLLSALARLQLEPSFAPLQQLGQIRAPVYFQAAPQEVSARQITSGYDGPVHFAALSSILGERQNIQQNPQFTIKSQQGLLRKPALLVTEPEQPLGFVSQNPDQQLLINQYQPLIQPQALQQIQPQPVIVNPQTITQIKPNQKMQPKIQDTENNDDQDETEFIQEQGFQSREIQQLQQGFQPQLAYQPQLAFQQSQQTQPQLFQTQQSFQPQPVQPQLTFQAQQTFKPQPAYGQPQTLNQYRPQSAYQPNFQPQEVYPQQYPIQPQANYYQPQDAVLTEAQLVNVPNQDQFLQQQFISQDPSQIGRQQAFQGQGSLQSGLDINQQGNGIEQTEDQDGTDTDEGDDDSSATAVATAFGSRTQPRVVPQYGAPIPRVQANPGYPNVPDYAREDAAESEVVAETTPANISKDNRRKSARLRSGRQRQLFTLDQSGRLVLVQN